MSEHLRHREVSRLEGFSDAVFAFALTLLVVSLETPKDTEELLGMMRGAGPFALMFAMVCWIWYQHNQFFRRYGLQDAWTVILNSVLLFVVLCYVYPLRFLTMALVGPLFMARGYPAITAADGGVVLLLYSTGIFLIFSTFALLHRHAWRKRRELNLTPGEELTLKFGMRAHLLSVALAVVSCVLIFALPDRPQYGGWIYLLMGPAHGWNGSRLGRAKRALVARRN